MTTEEAKKVFENGLENITKTNRLIEFRGKQKNTKEWVYGYYAPFFCEDTFEIIPAIISLSAERLDIYPVIPETVGQYTGLTDKNGEKVFEGDIVRHHNDNPDSEIKEKGVVFWDKKYCGWRRTSNGKFHHGVVDTYRLSHDCVYEVIGNIHDNPELLKEGAAE